MPRRPDPSDYAGGPDPHAPLLTRRELQVVRSIVDEGSAKLAAHRLGMTQRGVESTLLRARDRANVTTTAQLVRELARRGELEP